MRCPTLSSLLLLLLLPVFLPLCHAVSIASRANYCIDSTLTSFTSTRLIDSDALRFNLSSSSVADCQTLCCQTAGCLAFSLQTAQSVDSGVYACLLHQSIRASASSANWTLAYVNTGVREAELSVHSEVLLLSRLVDGVVLPNVSAWTASGCAAGCRQQPACVAVLAEPEAASAEQTATYRCTPIAYFTSIAADPSSQTVIHLMPRSTPQPTPISPFPPPPLSIPVRGWNTYDSYGGVPTEGELLLEAAALARHLLPHGYSLLSLDWGWWFSMQGATVLDEYGRYQPSPDRFPSAADGRGFSNFSSQLHALGLQLGIYTDAGVSIFFNNSGPHRIPVGEQCVWPGNAYFLDWREPAAQAWLDGVVQQWAEWGVDYVKIDCVGSITGYQQVLMYSTAIARSSNPDMRLSISPGYNGEMRSERVIAPFVNSYRVQVDFKDLWDENISFYPCLVTQVIFAAQLERALPGLPMAASSAAAGSHRLSFGDLDILPFGFIYSMAHGGNRSFSAFNVSQQQTVFSVWCFYRSPLLYGGSLRDEHLDPDSIAVVSNAALLHVHSYAYQTVTSFPLATLLTIRARSGDVRESFVLVANINSTQPWKQTLSSEAGGQCDWSEAWTGRVERAVRSVDVMLAYAEVAVWTISNCSSRQSNAAMED